MGSGESGFESGVKSSHHRLSKTSAGFIGNGSSTGRGLVVEPRPPLIDPHRHLRRNGFYLGGFGPNPGRFKGESLGILSVNPRSTIKDEDIQRFRELYSIPENFDIYPPYGSQRVDWKVLGETFLYEIAFKIGLRFPLPPFVRKVLGFFKIAPCELMSNAWRLLLALQALSDRRGVEVSLEAFRYSYYLAGHKSEEGRVLISIKSHKDYLIQNPQTFDDCSWKKRYFLVKEHCLFGLEGPGEVPLTWQKVDNFDNKFPPKLFPLVENHISRILQELWENRQLDILLSSTSLSQTIIWSDCVLSSGLSPNAFVERFEATMERLKSCPISRAKDLYRGAPARNGAAKKAKTTATEASLIPADLPGGTSPTRVVLMRGKVIELDQSFDGPDRVDFGKGISFLVDPSSFQIEGGFELTESIEGIRERGLPATMGYALSHVMKGLHGMIALNEDIGPSVRRCEMLESSVETLKKEVTTLQAAKAALEDEASRQLEEVKSLLEKEKDFSKSLLDGVKRKVDEAVLLTRRELMEEFAKGEHCDWNAEQEIRMCTSILEELTGENVREEEVDVDPVNEQPAVSPSRTPAE